MACGGTTNTTKKTKDPKILSNKTVAVSIPIEDETDSFSLYYVDELQEIPYLEGKDIVNLINKLLETELEVTNKDKIVTYKRKNGSYVTLDFNLDTVTFSEIDTFYNKEYDGSLYDITTYDPRFGDLIKRYPEADYIRPGHEITMKLKQDFDIEMVYDEDNQNYYLPLQTVNDVLISNTWFFMYFNGEKIFIDDASFFDSFEDEYYSVTPRDYSEKFAEFNFNELCLTLELHYGLKNIHNILSFKDLFKTSGLDKKLKSTSPLDVDNAIKEFITGYFDDLHSGVNGNSPYTGKDVTLNKYVDPARESYFNNFDKYTASYDKYVALKGEQDYYPYAKIGDTAYITFNEFYFDVERIWYEDTDLSKLTLDDITNEEYLDVLRLIQYADYQIKHDEDIKNVVVDLSLNNGGYIDVAIYIASWFLGTCDFYATNSISGAAYRKRYQADVNLDKLYDENDSLEGYNLYCITSPVSFSCGNLVPSLFKASDKVTLLGKPSGGGACAVQYFVTAGGTRFQCSSSICISTFKNGSFYDIDQGVTPHYTISNPDNFYDREKINDFIHSLI